MLSPSLYEWSLAETTSPNQDISRDIPALLYIILQAISIFYPMFMYCYNWPKWFLDRFKIIFNKNKMSEDVFPMISKSIVKKLKF